MALELAHWKNELHRVVDQESRTNLNDFTLDVRQVHRGFIKVFTIPRKSQHFASRIDSHHHYNLGPCLRRLSKQLNSPTPQHQHSPLTQSIQQRTDRQPPRSSVFGHRQLFLATVSCHGPVLLAVVTVALKLLGLNLCPCLRPCSPLPSCCLCPRRLRPHLPVAVLHVRLRRSACRSADT